MKKMTKKPVFAAALALSFLLCGCGAKKEGGVTVGIAQFAEHPSLDNCRAGFLSGLAEGGFKEGENLTVLYENAGAEGGIAAQIADNFLAKKTDLICAIATPMAQTAYNAAREKNLPVIYTAVTDPVEAELAKSDGSPVGEVTGTSDKTPVEAQLNMIKDLLPAVKTVGILYSTSEANSASQIKEYEEKAKELGLSILSEGIGTAADIPPAADSLIGKADCLTNITDNTVTNSLDLILDKAKKAGKPVFGSEIEQVKKGAVGSIGIDYAEVGRITGKMAAEVLKGEKKASEMKFVTVEEAKFYGNQKAAEALEITFPEKYVKDGVMVSE